MLGDSAFIIRQARNGKLRLLREGVLATQTMWDSLIFGGVRKDSHMYKVRALILEGPVDQSRSELFRTALGVPAISTLVHAFLLSPVSASMMWDVQRLPHPAAEERKTLGHVGPPVAGVEIKLRGEEDDILKGRVRGEVSALPLSPSRYGELPAEPSFPLSPNTAPRPHPHPPATFLPPRFPPPQRRASSSTPRVPRNVL